MDKFFAAQARKTIRDDTASSPESSDKPVEDEATPRKYPKGVVLGKDGKPQASFNLT